MADSVKETCERRINEAVCIDTKRIYDSCVSKDCLEDLRVTFCTASQAIIDASVNVKCNQCEIVSVSIDVDPVPFEHGFYTVDITFYFKLTFDCYTAPCTNPKTAIGYTKFTKKCILYGSDGNVKVFVSDTVSELTDCPESPQYTNPSAKVQAVDPVVLDVDLLEAKCKKFPIELAFSPSVIDPKELEEIGKYNHKKIVIVTLGLFSIVQMERDVQLTIPAYDYCVPDKECNCNTSNPCEIFSGIDFPISEFFPKEKLKDGPCCKDN